MRKAKRAQEKVCASTISQAIAFYSGEDPAAWRMCSRLQNCDSHRGPYILRLGSNFASKPSTPRNRHADKEKKETKRRMGCVVTNYNYLIKWEAPFQGIQVREFRGLCRQRKAILVPKFSRLQAPQLRV